MKWLVVIAGLGALLPFAFWLRGKVEMRLLLFGLIGFLPFWLAYIDGVDIALISWKEWFGYTQGIEVTAIDYLALAIFLSLPPRRYPASFRFVFWAYIAAVALSLFQAREPLAASFYVWQLLRMYLLYTVIVHACSYDERVPSALLAGMAVGLIAQVMLASWQRYGLGVIQAYGAFAHQNTFAMTLPFVILPHFAQLMAGVRVQQSMLVSLSGAAAAVLTTSRAALGLTALGFTIAYIGSALTTWTWRHAVIAIAGTVLFAGLAPIAYTSFEKRFKSAPLTEHYREREAFKRAAWKMNADYPMGVGANHYVVISKDDGYSEQAGVIRQSFGSHVHHVYILVLVETGYIGLFFFLLLIAKPLIAAFRTGAKHHDDPRGAMLLGCGLALLIVYLHSFVEWIFITSQIQYLFFITMGIIAGLQRSLLERDRDQGSGADANSQAQA